MARRLGPRPWITSSSVKTGVGVVDMAALGLLSEKVLEMVVNGYIPT